MRLTGHSLGYGAVAYGAVAVYGTAVPASALGGIDGGIRRKRRYVVRKDDRLLVFASREAAEMALQEAEPVKVEAPPQTKPKEKAKGKNRATKAVAAPQVAPVKARQVEPPAPPLQMLDIGFILAMARIRGQAQAAQEMLARKEYEALLDLAWQMQDEEDIEMLLMAVH